VDLAPERFAIDDLDVTPTDRDGGTVLEVGKHAVH
jgi:hypothetical protein